MRATERETILESVGEYLAFLESSEPDKRAFSAVGRSVRLPLTAFKHAEPFGEGNPLHDTDDPRCYYAQEEDNNPARWLPQFDVALLVRSSEPGQRFSLRRFRTLSAQEKRGRINPWTPYAVQSMAAAVMADGTFASAHTDWGWVGQRWMRVRAQGTLWIGDNAGEPGAAYPGEEGLGVPAFTLLSMAHQHAVYRALLWHVIIGSEGHAASLLVPCEAATILDLFRVRDLPAGATRRAALLHWVAAHWRRKASSPDEAARVAAHLRGQTRFVWRDGLVVSVLPSEEDKRLLKPAHKHAQTPSAPR